MWYVIIVILFLLWAFHYHGIPIFLYHQVNPNSNVTPELFEQHLAYLKKKKYKTITMSEFIENGAAKRTVLITLDDGYHDNYTYVFPLLKKYGMKATIFLNTLYIPECREGGVSTQEVIQAYLNGQKAYSSEYMSWKEIQEMYESGLVDFQAHSHKHMPVFSDTQLLGFFRGNELDSSMQYLYGDIQEGYPIFKTRGEYSIPGITIDKEFFLLFKEFYMKKLQKLSLEKDRIREGQEFIDQNYSYFHKVKIEDFYQRVTEDFQENKNQIEEHLGNEVNCFCWPWGHRSKDSLMVLQNLGVEAFVTTKKGTNDQLPNLEFIYRIELRKYTLQKFKWNLWAASNLILGKIYALIS